VNLGGPAFAALPGASGLSDSTDEVTIWRVGI